MGDQYSHRETGMSLLEVIIAIAILTLIGSLFSEYLSLSHANLKAISIRDKEKTVEEFLAETAATQARDFFETIPSPRSTNCATADFPGSWTTAQSPAGFNVSLLTDLSSASFSYVGDAAHEAAKNRCRNQQTPSAWSGLPNANGLYFCVLLSPTTTPENGSIFKTAPVFAEVYYGLFDLEQGQPLTCATFDHSYAHTRGGVIYYTLYWQTATMTGSRFFSQNGTFYAPASDGF